MAFPKLLGGSKLTNNKWHHRHLHVSQFISSMAKSKYLSVFFLSSITRCQVLFFPSKSIDNEVIDRCSTMGVGCQSRRFNCLFWRETRQRILGHEISPYPEVVRGGEWELTTRPREKKLVVGQEREELVAGDQERQLVVGQEQRELVAGEQRSKQQKAVAAGQERGEQRGWRGSTERQSTPEKRGSMG